MYHHQIRTRFLTSLQAKINGYLIQWDLNLTKKLISRLCIEVLQKCYSQNICVLGLVRQVDPCVWQNPLQLLQATGEMLSPPSKISLAYKRKEFFNGVTKVLQTLESTFVLMDLVSIDWKPKILRRNVLLLIRQNANFVVVGCSFWIQNWDK